MPETEAQLADWKAKTDAATAGPWEPFDAFSLTAPSQIDGFAFPMERQEDEWEIERNREFIATARTAMPLLLAAVESVLALHKPFEYAGLRQYCAECSGPTGSGYRHSWPCLTVRAITDALGGSEPDEGGQR